MRQAVVASEICSDGLWWNPALIARSSREAGFHAVKNPIIDADASGAILIPVQRVGTFALGARYFNEATIPATDLTGEIQTGTLTVTATIVSAAFASPITNRLALGLTHELLSRIRNCIGNCSQHVGGR